MESLALLVGIILLTMILSGPIAIGLTFIRSANPILNIIRRVIIALLCALGMGLGIGLILEGVAIGAKLFALFAIAASAYALKREFGRR
ncbi:hypothetical protein LBMAG04_11190 [Actinomycetes bacterium]|jgi:hypothetical protein|nr:hypothetical protein LBMAG04_11190 [Actinomycetes bacterium]